MVQTMRQNVMQHHQPGKHDRSPMIGFLYIICENQVARGINLASGMNLSGAECHDVCHSKSILHENDLPNGQDYLVESSHLVHSCAYAGRLLQRPSTWPF